MAQATDLFLNAIEAIKTLGNDNRTAADLISNNEDAAKNYTLLTRVTGFVTAGAFKAGDYVKASKNMIEIVPTKPENAKAVGAPVPVAEYIGSRYNEGRKLDSKSLDVLNAQIGAVIKAASSNTSFEKQAQEIFKADGAFAKAKAAGKADSKFRAYLKVAREMAKLDGNKRLDAAAVKGCVEKKAPAKADALTKASNAFKVLSELIEGKEGKEPVSAVLTDPVWKAALRALSAAVEKFPATTAATKAKGKFDKMTPAERAAFKRLLSESDGETEAEPETEAETETEKSPVVEMKTARRRKAA